MIYCSLDLKASMNNYRVVSNRNLKNINMAQLLVDAASIDWSSMYSLDDLDQEVEIFISIVNQLYDRHVPLIQKSTKARFNPWIKREQKSSLHKRDDAYLLWKRNKYSAISNHYLANQSAKFLIFRFISH
jgi:hypothetical protein